MARDRQHQLVPANLTNIFQPLDITVNKAAKNVIRKNYSAYFKDEVQRQLNEGVDAHEIKVDTRISVLKPLHAVWIVDVYKKLQTERGRQLIVNGFRKAHISEAMVTGRAAPPYPFGDLG